MAVVIGEFQAVAEPPPAPAAAAGDAPAEGGEGRPEHLAAPVLREAQRRLHEQALRVMAH